ncbi:hypothetical protein LI90_3790 [Carbonactinospora thermoautotrophica]|uniref:Uncharacterized protein n=1 Tax=Carbonactinospora thermoautotrophica TaxID=1469144 RepID=A0A132MY44_9ACTN|nr:hypothetical protein LI90_3790 [Carbonactinospora thermoautotrophica]
MPRSAPGPGRPSVFSTTLACRSACPNVAEYLEQVGYPDE